MTRSSPIRSCAAIVLLAAAFLVAVAAPASAADTLLSQGKAATASSSEGGGATADAAVDGDLSTRWSSAFSDPQWLQVDLGVQARLARVVLRWEQAYARSFTLQSSADGTSWTTLHTTAAGTGGTQTIAVSGTGRHVRLTGTQRGTPYGYSLWELQVHGEATGIDHATHHEFQANCSVTANRPDDPIVLPGLPGASHLHTFIGNTTTNAHSTLASLLAGGTSCTNPHDRSAYWFPSFFKGDQLVQPVGPQVVYYKSGVLDYTTVRTFPQGLRFVVGSPGQSLEEFRNAPGAVEGFECGDSFHNYDLPRSCPAGTQVNVRFQAPSCWDGVNLDSSDHKRHMAYPVSGYCPGSHPVPVPMLEFKIAFPADGDLSQARLSSGRGYSWHYDFFNAWEPAILRALVRHCVNGGLQCDPRGFDLYKPHRGAALDTNYNLP
ncbi:DUF1996 domain-containing protein [Nonomuraea sp. NPDC050643]|uniref:DUF1996 domain-containing protein n=1 Tax=Nonomuraea sp. NPDC050643 TaxID=3155660 RepID=UPI0033EA8F8B